MSPHRPKKISLSPLQRDILLEVADPVEVDPAYVCVLASAETPQASPEQVVTVSEQAICGLSRQGLISFCKWSRTEGHADQAATLMDFCDALRNNVLWDFPSRSWKSDSVSEQLLVEITNKGEVYLRA